MKSVKKTSAQPVPATGDITEGALYSYRVVWCPKYRRKVLTPPVDTRLKQIIEEVCQERQATILALEIMPDHVHLMLDMDPQFGIHRLVRLLKGRSSRLLRQEFPPLKSRLPTLWTNSYFVSTVGGAPWAIIKQYIEAQKDVVTAQGRWKSQEGFPRNTLPALYFFVLWSKITFQQGCFPNPCRTNRGRMEKAGQYKREEMYHGR